MDLIKEVQPSLCSIKKYMHLLVYSLLYFTYKETYAIDLDENKCQRYQSQSIVLIEYLKMCDCFYFENCAIKRNAMSRKATERPNANLGC